MTRPSRALPLVRTLALIGMLAPAAAAANTIDVDGMFAANSLSLWTGGPGFSLDKSGFLGPGGWDLGDSVGSIGKKCAFGICIKYGAEVGARTSGRAGIDYGLKLDSGTFDVHYPARLQLSIPDFVSWDGFNAPTVDIGTRLFGLNGLALPTGPGQPLVIQSGVLQSRGPDLQAHLNLIAQLQAFAGAQVCLGICYGPGIGPIGINESKEIVSINNNHDGQIRVLGDTLVSANQSFSALGGLINGSVNLPRLDSSGGFSFDGLAATQRDRVAVVNVNIAQIAANAVGLPIPLSGKLGPIGYNLLQANAGAFLDLQETLNFTPSATANLGFTSDVIPIVNGIAQPATQLISFQPGQTVTFRPVRAIDEIGVRPFVTLGGHVTNDIDLLIGGNVDVKALGVDVAGLTLGPLVNERFGSDNLGTLDVNLFHGDFDLGELGTIGGRPFNLAFSNCQVLFGGEFNEGVCGASGYGPGDTDFLGDGFQQDEFSSFDCAARFFGDPESCSVNFIAGLTSPYFSSAFGEAFIGGDDARILDGVVPNESTTDEGGWAALLALGSPGPFIIPAGDPFDSFQAAPQPATWALLGLGLVGLLAGRGARHRSAFIRPDRRPA